MAHSDQTKQRIREGVIRRLQESGQFKGTTGIMRCVCGQDFFRKRMQQLYCTKACRPKQPEMERRQRNVIAVSARRKELKRMAVELLGGKCVACGYSKCIAALEFHHKDPSQKDFAISDNGNTAAWEKVKIEVLKCDLLCANCHREIHAKDY